MLQIKNVNLCVGSNKLLHNINLSLEQGKIYGLLGANGAGKTTLFKSMLGLTAYTGEILSDKNPAKSSEFGSLIEYPAFYPKLSVMENLKLHASYIGLTNPDIENSLKQVNLYSKGLLYSSASSFARCVGHGSTCSSKIDAVVHCISIQKQTTALTFLRDEVSFFSLKSPNRTTLHHRH